MQKYKRAREKKTRDKRFKVVRQCAYIHTLSPLGYILHLLNNFIVHRRPPYIGAKGEKYFILFQCGTSLDKAYLCGLSQHLSNVGQAHITIL
jgi:hypothetical protein